MKQLDSKAVALLQDWIVTHERLFGVKPTIHDMQEYYKVFASEYVEVQIRKHIKKQIQKKRINWPDTEKFRDVIRFEEAQHYFENLDKVLEDLNNHPKLLSQYRDFYTEEQVSAINAKAEEIFKRQEQDEKAAQEVAAKAETDVAAEPTPETKTETES